MWNCCESMMGWRGAGFEAEMPQHYMRSWQPQGSSKPSSSPAAFLVSVHPGSPGTGLMARAGQAPSPFSLGSAGSSSCPLAQVCGAAQKMLWRLQSQVLVSKRGTESPAQLWANLIPSNEG